jgi:small-conductance mechanosensitive channel
MKTRYDQDFHAWTLENANLLRNGQVNEIDILHIAEELESMGARERREVLNRLQVLIMHLLKHQYQPARRSKSWLLTIIHQRTALERLLQQSPSLKTLLNQENLQAVYRKAVKEAIIETDLESHWFPLDCPYQFEQLLNDEYFPE